MQRLFLAIIVSGLLLLVTSTGLLVVDAETRPHAPAGLSMDHAVSPQHPAPRNWVS
jgi:hypothetical protein